MNILKTLNLISKQAGKFTVPSVTKFSRRKSPYLVLISCILSLRTKDKTTVEAGERLFKIADTPEETEFALREIIPKNKWIDLNTILVTFGQNICLPVSPYCSKCNVSNLCKRAGVKSSR